MDNNTSKAIFNLMQKVVDKLDDISDKINQKEEINFTDINAKNDDKISNRLGTIIKNQKIIQETNLKLKNKIFTVINAKTTFKEKNKDDGYYLIDKNAFIKNRMILLVLFGTITIWCTFKFIPKYFLEKSTLKKDKWAYELFYNYVYLKQFENSKNITADLILEKIYQNDSVFIEKYNLLLKTHQNQVKKNQQLNKIKPFPLK